MRRQFELQYYLAHPETKVVTRDGRSARVLATDVDKQYPVAAAIENQWGWVEVFQFYGDGKYFSIVEDTEIDLFFE